MKTYDPKEKRLLAIQDSLYPNQAGIVISANMPGAKKNNGYTALLINHFRDFIKEKNRKSLVSFIASPVGNAYLIHTKPDIKIKEQLIALEENHPLGRLVDLDYYLGQQKSVSRKELGYPLRKCFLCEEIAYSCMREQRHSSRQVIRFFKKQVKAYFSPIFTNIIKEAIFTELNLEDKFGLVTPTSRGSHPDMDYELMSKVALALGDDFVQFIWLGMDYSSKKAYLRGQKLGIDLEKKMLRITSGVNAYKGLIFLAGFILLGYGNMLASNKTWQDFPMLIKKLGKDILNNLSNQTYGEQLIASKQIYGARGEILSGLSTVLTISEYLKQQTINQASLHMALIKIIGLTHDSVLIKRSQTWEKYLQFRGKITAITSYQQQAITELTKECIAENISCGGAADILIGAILVLYLQEISEV